MNEPIRGPWQAPSRLAEPTFFSPAKWRGKQAPQTDWMVDGCFVRGSVAILSGDGGLGKSLLCMQLQTAAQLGKEWLGLCTAKCRSLGVYCEDDLDELHRREERICAHYECSMGDLDGVLMDSRAGRDSVLMNFPRWGGEGHTTPLYEQIAQTATSHGAQLVIIDTLADAFNGNEIDRNQPRTFIRRLRQLAIAIQGCVVLTQHPSVDGIATGTGRSGSTGWNNSVRSRLYLTLPKRKKDAEGESTNERLLRTMKSNSGQWGGKIKLNWERGVFKRVYDQERLPGFNAGTYDDEEVEF